MYMILDGEFEYESMDRESKAGKKKAANRDMDIRKLLFARKKVTIDDRRKFT